MSEPNQLYACLHISRPRFDEFLRSRLEVETDEPLMTWLSEASYYGERYTPELVRERVPSGATVAQWVHDVTVEGIMGFPMPFRNHYDDATQTWTLGVLDFSENYDDYITAATIFRQASKHKNVAGNDGLLVYGYLFENGAVTLALDVGMGTSRFLSETEAIAFVAEANGVMESLVAEGAAKAGEDA
jgi:hypothetical protein